MTEWLNWTQVFYVFFWWNVGKWPKGEFGISFLLDGYRQCYWSGEGVLGRIREGMGMAKRQDHSPDFSWNQAKVNHEIFSLPKPRPTAEEGNTATHWSFHGISNWSDKYLQGERKKMALRNAIPNIVRTGWAPTVHDGAEQRPWGM